METTRNQKRNINNNLTIAIYNLLGHLNQFCFHENGADDNCNGCCFKNNGPCPLAKFYDFLDEKFIELLKKERDA